MPNRAISLAFAGALLLALPIGCARASTDGTLRTAEPAAEPSSPSRPEASAGAPFDPDYVPDDATITIARTGGVGAVLYTLNISAAGGVSYEGVNLVDSTGSRSGTAAPEAFAQTWRSLVVLDRDHRTELDACVAGRLDDGSAYTITLTASGQTTRLAGELDNPCPDNDANAELIAQYHALVALAAAKPWIGTRVE